MIDWRNAGDIPLATLRSTDDLGNRLPLKNASVQPKLDGQRYTLEIGPEGVFLISRSKHGKTKGVEASKYNQFISRELEPWMKDLTFPKAIVLDGELCAMGASTSSEVTRLDTEKVFVAFDIIYCDADIRNFPYKDRYEILTAVIDKLESPHIDVIPSENYEEFTEENLKECIEYAVRNGLEGFVIKENVRDYDKNWYGWKIKPEETDDAFIVAIGEEKKHDHGKVTKTGRTGTVGVAQYREDGKSMMVAWVPIPEEERVSLEEKSIFLDRILEFKHNGWNGKDQFRFPRFVCWREDKPKEDCKFRF